MNTIHLSSSTYQWLKNRAKETAQTPDEVAETLLRQQQKGTLPDVMDLPPGWVVQTPGVMGGKPHIIGHRIRVQDVVIWHYVQGFSPEAIAKEYQLEVAAVYAALTHYHNYRSGILADIQAEQKLMEQLEKPSSKIPSNRLAELQQAYQVEQSQYQEALTKLLSGMS